MCCNAFEECGMPLALSVRSLDGQSSSGIIIALVLAGQSFLVLLMWLAIVSPHCFCTAFGMLSITILSIYLSFANNIGIATTNTELIVNAVILLFLIMMDESFSKVFGCVQPKIH